MKKEFISYWSSEQVSANLHKMPISRARFFHETTKDIGHSIEIAIPDDIRYDDLAVFVGRKTKVTIETVD